jgi:protein TonB
MARRKKQRSVVYIVSVGAHLLVGMILVLIPQDKLREVVAIALNEAKKEEKKPEPPKPPEHPPEHHAARTPGHAARSAGPAPVAANAGPAAFADIGVALDSSSLDGVAVNVAPPVMAAVAPVVAAPKPKVLMAQKRTEVECTEDIVKARPLAVVRPSYTVEARSARVEGRIRIELQVNEQGEITSARVVSGLGYGLDEAALAAAQRLRFTPATRCGRAVAAPFFLFMRFALPK